MIDKAVQYYLDKDKQIDIRVDNLSYNRMHVSIYNDRGEMLILRKWKLLIRCGQNQKKRRKDLKLTLDKGR